MHRIATAVFTAAAFVTLAYATEIEEPYGMLPVAKTATTATGQPIEVPAHPTVLVTAVQIAVNGALPVHKHPYQRYVYVIAGTLIVTNTETGAATTYHAGDFIAEMRGTWHFGKNGGTERVRLIAIDQVPAGTATNTVMKP
jgi:quercetin dioxygenase-like cupin family protein